MKLQKKERNKMWGKKNETEAGEKTNQIKCEEKNERKKNRMKDFDYLFKEKLKVKWNKIVIFKNHKLIK